jgi:lysyl-tRNA synthetase class 2
VTLTASRLRSQSSSRLRWVPAAAGWTVGVIATLSLIASVSPVIRWLIRVPREFINDYIFNFPDTSFAWSFVLALLAGALTARKRIAWWLLVLNLLLAAGLNVAGLIADHPSPAKSFGETLGLGLHLAAVVVLIFGYREFWAKVRQGALYKAAGVLLTGWASGSPSSRRRNSPAGRPYSSTRSSGCSVRWR